MGRADGVAINKRLGVVESQRQILRDCTEAIGPAAIATQSIDQQAAIATSAMTPNLDSRAASQSVRSCVWLRLRAGGALAPQ